MRKRTLILLTALLLVVFGTAVGSTRLFAAPEAIGWVGNVFPALGSSHTITQGGSFDVYMEVWKDGVTNSAGQGADISCYLRWTDDGWSSSTDTPMSYHTDIGNNDQYKGTLTPAAGSLEMKPYCVDDSDSSQSWPSGGNILLTVNPPGGAINGARAIWLDQTTIAWNGTAGTSYKLLYDPDGGMDLPTAGATACSFPSPAAPCYVDLTASGTISGYAKNPNTSGLTRLTSSLSATDAKHLLKGEVAVASYGSGTLLDATHAQIQSVLDDLYATAAAPQTFGVSYSGGVPSVKLWAPTAKSVTLRRYADSTTGTYTSHALTEDAASGVWSVTGAAGWDREFFLFDVEVYVPTTDAVEHNLVTDPYAVSLSTDSVRSQFVNLADADLKPSGWDALAKPPLAAFEDSVIYEVHVRDFSINDTSVSAANRGTYKAFTETSSDGMQHLLAMEDAGLTHVHLLPAFDIASVPEASVDRTPTPNPTGYARDAQDQQSIVGAARATDGFNWGYDPYHYGAPEGSYSTNPDGVTRIIEFREMVKALNDNGLRVVMDVVYNHTAASTQEAKSVLDKVVPGYYHRYNLNGTLENSSCCSDTASEYDMMEKLMIDTLVRWATDYKVDGFRFDLMNLHTVQNAVNAKNAVQAVRSDIYVYGEGWDFGSAAAKGLTYAKQGNMAGTGIGTFNDRIRDAAHGGLTTDPLEVRKQGFINGLSYDWNGYCYSARNLSDLNAKMNTLRSALKASGDDYTNDPQESVPYITKHDNEALFDLNVFRLPNGVGDPGACGGGSYTVPTASMDDRVRSQNMGLSLVTLSQGVPFIHMGSDILRSKSLDRNSYDSGDWFNKVDWTYSDNNFGKGLPPDWDNGPSSSSNRWPVMAPLLANTSLDPATADMQFSAAQMREFLRIRQSSKLFRLESEAEVNSRISFLNSDNSKVALLVMEMDGVGLTGANFDSILVFFNANKTSHTFTVAGAEGYALHPVQADAIDPDPVVQGASFDEGTDTFTIPARTTAVFVKSDTPDNVLSIGTISDDPGSSGTFTIDLANDEAVTAGTIVFSLDPASGVTLTGATATGRTTVSSFNESSGTVTIQTGAVAAGSGPIVTVSYSVDGSAAAASTPIDLTNATTLTGTTALTLEDGTFIVIGEVYYPGRTAFVHLFEWKWTDIAQECENWLGPKGFSAVQVSPPQAHITNLTANGQYNPWWIRYQPTSYELNSRSGTEAEFIDMVNRCTAVGVDIYVDAVINHMSGGGGDTTGTTSPVAEYNYPDVPYNDTIGSFHHCGLNGDDEIDDYGDLFEARECHLSGLDDLATETEDVRAKIAAYLNYLISLGVKGARIDAAKHMYEADIANIQGRLTDPNFYIFQEVIPEGDITASLYYGNGDVTDFQYGKELKNKFDTVNGGDLRDLETFGESWGLLPSDKGVVFTDNHDNQRGHGGGGDIMTFRWGNAYTLGNVFMLGWPHGYPKVMSSYDFPDDGSDSSNAQGPPSVGGATTDIYQPDGSLDCQFEDPSNSWICEHRWLPIANMVGFRNWTDSTPTVDNWQEGATNQIGFGRGGGSHGGLGAATGFLAINNTASDWTTTFTTDLPEGEYCNVTVGNVDPSDPGACERIAAAGEGPTSIVVNASGQATVTLPAWRAFAIHIGQKLSACSATAAAAGFNVDISITGATSSDVLLGWLDYGPAYDVRYSTADPYFSPSSTGTQLTPVPGSNSATHTAVVPSLTNYFYTVDVDNCAGTATSERVGKFTFEIVPGG